MILAFMVMYKILFFPSTHATTIMNICKPQSGLENAIRKLSLRVRSCFSIMLKVAGVTHAVVFKARQNP